jgi:DNA-binding protein HU-beta
MALTKSQIQAELAESTGLSKKDIKTVLDAQAELAYKEAKNGYSIQGIGKLVLQNREARMGRNPATGEPIQIAAKTAVKFRVAKIAKDSII